jgi:hypothetical protein
LLVIIHSLLLALAALCPLLTESALSFRISSSPRLPPPPPRSEGPREACVPQSFLFSSHNDASRLQRPSCQPARTAPDDLVLWMLMADGLAPQQDHADQGECVTRSCYIILPRPSVPSGGGWAVDGCRPAMRPPSHHGGEHSFSLVFTTHRASRHNPPLWRLWSPLLPRPQV